MATTQATEPKTKTRLWNGPKDFETNLVPLEHLHADPENENTHSDDQIQRMTISLSTHGQQEQLKVRPDPKRDKPHLMLVTGDARLRAADILGWTHLAVSGYTGDKAEEYRVMSNRLGQMSKLDDAAIEKTSKRLKKMKGFDPVIMGYTDEELKKISAKLQAKAGEIKPKTPAAPKTQAKAPSADRAHTIEFDNPEQRESFLKFLAMIGEANTELKSTGEKLMWYFGTAGGEPGWNGNGYTLAFANPDQRNAWATFLARISRTYGGEDAPHGDIARILVFLDETIE